MSWDMFECNTVHLDLQKPLPHLPPHRRVLRTESGLLLSLDPTQHLFNDRLDPHVVQSHLKLAHASSPNVILDL